jgi:hypothetical protein
LLERPLLLAVAHLVQLDHGQPQELTIVSLILFAVRLLLLAQQLVLNLVPVPLLLTLSVLHVLLIHGLLLLVVIALP